MSPNNATYDFAQHRRTGAAGEGFDGKANSTLRSERLLAAVERSLDAKRGRPAFPVEIEARFESDLRDQRVRHLRRAIVLGFVIFQLYGLSYFVTAPDVAVLDLYLRTGVVGPIGLGLLWAIGQVDGRMRETLCGLGMVIATAVPILVLGLGGGPLVTLSAPSVWMTVVFGNSLLALRFSWACILSAIAVAASFAILALRSDLSAGVAHVIQFDIAAATLISLVAAHQIEAAQRRGYLLNLRETLRSQRLAAENTALARLSSTDPLTGLANRRAFAERLEALWVEARIGDPFALLLVDVDYFKRFNDLYGHGAGDLCLCEVADLLRDRAAQEDEIVARYGGEEFALLVPRLDRSAAIALAEQVRTALEARRLPHAGRGDGLGHVTVSVGVSTSADAVRSPAELVEAADAALYQAKSAGRNRVGPIPAAAARGIARPTASGGLAAWRPPDTAELRENGAMRRSA